jgi:hypothetical protein
MRARTFRAHTHTHTSSPTKQQAASTARVCANFHTTMGGKASKAVSESKKRGGKELILDDCDLKVLNKKILSQFPDLRHLSVNQNHVRVLLW